MTRLYWYAAQDASLRIQARRVRGRLRDLGISNRTLERYRVSVEYVLWWELCHFHGVARPIDQLDSHLAAYVEYL